MKTIKTMNKLIIIALLMATSLGFTSCGDDDDNNEPDSIVGVWLSTADVSETFINGVSQGVEQESIDENNFTRLTFNADGSFIDFTSDDSNGTTNVSSDPGTYRVEGSTVFVLYDGENESEQAEVTVNATTLVIVFTDEDVSSDGDMERFVSTVTLRRQ